MQWNIQKVEAPFDSDDFPKGILASLLDEMEHGTVCGNCLTSVADFPRSTVMHPCAVPMVMFQADLFCTDCIPYSYQEETGERINSFTGEAES